MPRKFTKRSAAPKARRKKILKKKAFAAKASTRLSSVSPLQSMKRDTKKRIPPAAMEKHGRSMAHRNADTHRRTGHKPEHASSTPSTN